MTKRAYQIQTLNETTGRGGSLIRVIASSPGEARLKFERQNPESKVYSVKPWSSSRVS